MKPTGDTNGSNQGETAIRISAGMTNEKLTKSYSPIYKTNEVNNDSCKTARRPIHDPLKGAIDDPAIFA